jgi:hypothetical protein
MLLSYLNKKFLEQFPKTLSAAEHPSTRHNTAVARQPSSKLPDALARTPTVFVRRDGHVPPLYDGPYAILCQSLHHFTLRIGDKEDKVYTFQLKPCTDPTVPPAQPRARGCPPSPVCCRDFPPLGNMAARRVHFAPPHARELCQEPFSPGQPAGVFAWYTHKTSCFKTSGFKTSETSGLQNVSFTKRQVYKMSGLQNVRSSKRPVAKKHPYIFCTCGWWKSAGSVAAVFAGKVKFVFYSLF